LFDFVSDKLFITGCVLGVLSVILGGFVLTGDTAYYILAGGVLFALALIAGAWYFGSRKDARRRHYLKEEEQLKQELAELEKRFQQEGAPLTAYMLRQWPLKRPSSRKARTTATFSSGRS
jgi:hypothetical protein